jgi:hypothetical protein
MSSLYKRATPIQRKMLKIIEGAVKQAYYSHPEIGLGIATIPHIAIERFARCVGKRAVGTLSAQMLDRFAEGASSVTVGEVTDRFASPLAG